MYGRTPTTSSIDSNFNDTLKEEKSKIVVKPTSETEEEM